MQYLKKRDIKIICGITVIYCIKVVYLLNKSNKNNVDWGFLFISFIFLCSGILGLLNKVNPFYSMFDYIGPIAKRKMSYDADDDLLKSIIGRLGNISAIFLGIYVLFSDL